MLIQKNSHQIYLINYLIIILIIITRSVFSFIKRSFLRHFDMSRTGKRSLFEVPNSHIAILKKIFICGFGWLHTRKFILSCMHGCFPCASMLYVTISNCISAHFTQFPRSLWHICIILTEVHLNLVKVEKDIDLFLAEIEAR